MYPAPPVTSVDVVLTVRHCTVRRVIVAVVVTHSAPRHVLEGCLGALQTAGGVDRIIVVDNGDRATMIDAAMIDAGVELIRTLNRGYGAAANSGFVRARALGADAVALLNDDVIVHRGWTEPLGVELGGERVGAVQPKLLIAGSSPPRVNSLGVAIGPDGAGIDIGHGEIDLSPQTASDLRIFTGGAVVFNAEFLIATGGFDERYFLYYEDVDLARRGQALGWHYRLVPTSVVEHVGGVSTGNDPGATRYYQERNRLRAAVRHADVATIGRAFWLSFRRLRHAPRAIHRRALVAGVGSAPRVLLERLSGRNVAAGSRPRASAAVPSS